MTPLSFPSSILLVLILLPLLLYFSSLDHHLLQNFLVLTNTSRPASSLNPEKTHTEITHAILKIPLNSEISYNTTSITYSNLTLNASNTRSTTYSNLTINSTNISSTTSSNLTTNEKDERSEKSPLGKLEMGLARARASILRAVLARNNTSRRRKTFVPRGAIYRNAHAFYQSYMEMEKRFKVFVYKEGGPPLVHSGPCRAIYSSEGRFIHELNRGTSRFLTNDSECAHAYFMPFSVAKMVHFIYEPNSHDNSPLRRFVSDYVNIISSKYPFWNKSQGADHFMLSCHDWVSILLTHENMYAG
eukprot:TRINITY_DN1449_c0_g1_i2.p1 TRINITY_DN1449_c0_g1~~TRINITY_DN1449_c0_g1_i2.p1  ORF type:complete len:302 (+),score=15.59 TRINITY_DN1449_c0_g1_i2:90-995(+)